ncbi:acyl-CoA carboxylase epsilon subunit [Kitasatospora cineracea]|uniref:acyl-CoA carboxylase epsilon subunit n=1 Tax=Kitasatospora cineracea TaxID=88074 RepID=UPI000F495133
MTTPDTPALHILHGSPTPDELAVLTAVLLTTLTPHPTPSPPPPPAPEPPGPPAPPPPPLLEDPGLTPTPPLPPFPPGTDAPGGKGGRMTAWLSSASPNATRNCWSTRRA